MKIHYLEIVTSDVNGVCESYEKSHDVRFEPADSSLGGARTCRLPDGGLLGVRAPMSETEEPVVRPYWLTETIEQDLEKVEKLGALIAHPPLEIPGKGIFAIYILGGIHHGLWQL